MPDRSRIVSAVLFIALGMVGMFVVSAVAGLFGDESVGSGLRVFGPAADQPQDIRVEVLNGAGTSGLARQATHQLRDQGFDVVYFGNASHFHHERSVVIDRLGELHRARGVATALGIDSVATALDSTLLLEVTVVLGTDWPAVQPEDKGWLQRLREAVRSDTGISTEPGQTGR